MKLSAALLRLLLVIKAFFANCAEQMVWELKSPQQVNDERRSSVNKCLLKCGLLNPVSNAVVAADGTCSCDHFHFNTFDAANIYLYREHKYLPPKYLIFIPFTDGGYGFQSLGVEHVPYTIHGSQMHFTETGPDNQLPNRKAMRLTTSKNGAEASYISYSIPQSLINKAQQNGIIMSFWVKAPVLKPGMAIVEFRKNGVNHGKIHFWQAEAEHFRFQNSAWAVVSQPADVEWHHFVWIFNHLTKKHRVFNNGDLSSNNNINTGGLEMELSDTLNFGYRLEHDNAEVFADVAMYCFTMQELGSKTLEDLQAVVAETKTACDNF